MAKLAQWHEHRRKSKNKLYCPSICFNNKRPHSVFIIVNLKKLLRNLALSFQMLPLIHYWITTSISYLSKVHCVFTSDEKVKRNLTLLSLALALQNKWIKMYLEVTSIQHKNWNYHDLENATWLGLLSFTSVSLLASHNHNVQCRLIWRVIWAWVKWFEFACRCMKFLNGYVAMSMPCRLTLWHSYTVLTTDNWEDCMFAWLWVHVHAQEDRKSQHE